LAAHPELFKVTIIERMPVTGGQATSISLDEAKYGTSWMNDGVQGGSPVRTSTLRHYFATNLTSQIFKHTFNFFRKFGHQPQEIKLQVAFGKGPDSFWTNCFPSKLVDQFSSDIKKFGKILKIIKWTMPILGIVPIRIMLRMFFFSNDFGNKMVYPLIALFLGTGNQVGAACTGDTRLLVWSFLLYLPQPASIFPRQFAELADFPSYRPQMFLVPYWNDCSTIQT
jgi:hypothetical protein